MTITVAIENPAIAPAVPTFAEATARLGEDRPS